MIISFNTVKFVLSTYIVHINIIEFISFDKSMKFLTWYTINIISLSTYLKQILML